MATRCARFDFTLLLPKAILLWYFLVGQAQCQSRPSVFFPLLLLLHSSSIQSRSGLLIAAA